MSTAAHWLVRTVSLVVVLGLVGCGGQVKTYNIPGKLVYEDGSPVTAGGTITLQTKAGDQTIDAHGQADSEGKFTLSTFKEGDGVVAGEHAVSVTPLPAGDSAAPTTPPIPAKYSDFSTSGLKTSVTPDTTEIVITISKSGN